MGEACAGGSHVDYPVMSDMEFAAKGEAVGNDRALFLVGNARSNAVVRELEPGLPVRIEGDDVVVGGTHVAPTDGEGGRSQLGVAFIYPNPKRSDRYVVVVEGVGALGTWGSPACRTCCPTSWCTTRGWGRRGGRSSWGGRA